MAESKLYTEPVSPTALQDFAVLSNSLSKPVDDATCSYCGCLSSVSIDGIDSCHCCDDSVPYNERPFNALPREGIDHGTVREMVKHSNSHVPNPGMVDEWHESVISHNAEEALFCAW